MIQADVFQAVNVQNCRIKPAQGNPAGVWLGLATCAVVRSDNIGRSICLLATLGLTSKNIDIVEALIL